MRGRSLLLIGAIAVLLAPDTVLAQGSIQPQHSDPAWQASYWNNMSLEGNPVLRRGEEPLDHDWGSGSPAPEVAADGFSARWTRYLELAAGTYRFTATSDDGIRVWLDGTPIINEWYDHGVKTVSVDKALSAGHHWLQVEYYENAGVAVARFSWAPVSSISNWRGEYYNNMSLSGSPALVRDDAKIDFNWGKSSPAPGVINSDTFSVRWTRSLQLEAGSYRFSMTVDDGGRLWVQGHLLIDAWKDQGATTYTGVIYVPKGSIPVKMEFYENWDVAVARLSWGPADAPPPPPDGVIVDDKDSGFLKGGAPSAWHTANEGYNGRLYWTKNNDYARPNYNWARWTPKLTARRYEVYVYIPGLYTTTAQARYWISHADGYTLRVVSQSANGGKWVSLGTYRFLGNANDYVSLADVTFEPYLSRLIAFDAVKWVPR